MLVELGAVRGETDPVDEVLAAVLAADRATLERLGPDRVAAARTARPGLVVWAAAHAGPDAIRLAVDFGWDVCARGRVDVPIAMEWETALHHAAGEGRTDLVHLLLDLGADPSIRDGRFDASPADWARHFGRDELAALIEGRAVDFGAAHDDPAS